MDSQLSQGKTAAVMEENSTTMPRFKDPRVTVIEAGRANREYFSDLWRFRELFFVLLWRDVIVRYKQTYFGIGWSLFRPLFTALVFGLVFGKMIKIPSGGMPYAPYIYVALVPWFFFTQVVTDVNASLVTYAGLVSKVYFPRLIAPLVVTTVALLDMAAALVFVPPMLWIFDVPFGWNLLLLLPLTVLAAGISLGMGLCFSALNVKYRDVGLLVPYLLQFGLFISPIVFPSDLVPYPWRLLYSLNPMVGVIEGFRWVCFPGQSIEPAAFAISVLSAVVFLLLGYRMFRGMERTLADLI